jgi:hypothetical protein
MQAGFACAVLIYVHRQAAIKQTNTHHDKARQKISSNMNES